MPGIPQLFCVVGLCGSPRCTMSTPIFRVDPERMAAEIDRQMARLIDSMHTAADVDSIGRYGSPVVTRLLEATERWVGRLE